MRRAASSSNCTAESNKRTRFDITFIFPRELRILLERNGLKIRKIWGNYDGSALNADSPRMIVMTQPA